MARSVLSAEEKKLQGNKCELFASWLSANGITSYVKELESKTVTIVTFGQYLHIRLDLEETEATTEIMETILEVKKNADLMEASEKKLRELINGG